MRGRAAIRAGGGTPQQTRRRDTVKIALTSVFVDDPNKAHRFYTEVLGFVTKMHIPDAFLGIVSSPAGADGTGLLLEPNGNLGADAFQKGVYEAGLPTIVFGVEDIHREYERLKGLGVVFRKEPTQTDYGIETVFEDTC